MTLRTPQSRGQRQSMGRVGRERTAQLFERRLVVRLRARAGIANLHIAPITPLFFFAGTEHMPPRTQGRLRTGCSETGGRSAWTTTEEAQ